MPLQGPVHDIQKWHKKKTGWKVERFHIYNYIYIIINMHYYYIYIYVNINLKKIICFKKNVTFVMARKLNIHLNE